MPASVDAADVTGRGARRRTLRGSSVLDRPWARVLAVYLLSRVYSSALLGGMFALATALRWPFASVRSNPSFFTFSGSWDAWFYRSIAEHGYPAAVPLDASGHVLPNPWAFLPVFPMLERALTAATGLTTYAAGTVIAVVAGAGASLVLERLVAPHVGERRALWVVALFAFGPTAFLLQVAYAESLFLVLVFAALLALQRGRYLVAAPLTVIAAFTRPGALAIPVALAAQFALQWYRDRRVPPRPGRAVTATVVMVAAGLVWPVIADLATGRHGTYLDTELSWWTGWVGRPAFVPFTPWFLMGGQWLGTAGLTLVVVVIGTTAFWMLRGSPRALGTTIRSYGAAYALYLFAVFLPQFSLPRLLMPLAPLLGAGAFTGTHRRRVAWLLGGAAAQPVFVVLVWFLSYP